MKDEVTHCSISSRARSTNDPTRQACDASTRNAPNNGIWAIGTGTPTGTVNGSRLFDYNNLVATATGRTAGATNPATDFQGPYDQKCGLSFAVWKRVKAFMISAFAASGPCQPSTFTHLPGSRSL